MEFDKSTIVNHLKEQGDQSKAEQADKDLPDQVDSERDAGLLQRFGIDPQALVSKFTEGKGIPGF